MSVRANAKFAAPDAGPDALGGGRREDLKAVVAHLRGELGVSFVYCWHGGLVGCVWGVCWVLEVWAPILLLGAIDACRI